MNEKSDIIGELFKAVEENNICKIDELLTSGIVDVDVPNPKEKDRTALHVAAHEGQYDLVCTLVDKYNANVNIKDRDGEIPLQLATDRYHMKIVKFLLKRNSNLQEYAARDLNSDQIEEFFEAVNDNDIDKVVELINTGVDVNAEDRSNFQRTALEIASALGYYDLVQVLVDKGADIEHEDEIGECAYHKAVNNKHDSIAKLLVQHGFKDTYGAAGSSVDSDVSLNFMPNIDV